MGAQHFHRLKLVLQLGAFILASDHHSGGKVGDAYGGISSVYRLSARSSRAVNIYAQVAVIDLNFNTVIHFWGDKNGGKGSVSAGIGIKRGNAHQAVHPSFLFNKP